MSVKELRDIWQNILCGTSYVRAVLRALTHGFTYACVTYVGTGSWICLCMFGADLGVTAPIVCDTYCGVICECCCNDDTYPLETCI